MKILHTADWHIGQFKGPVVDGVNLRSQDTIAYNGWFVTTDSFLVRVAECWDQLISMAKNIISRYAKQKSYAMEKYYKKWRKLNYA